MVIFVALLPGVVGLIGFPVYGQKIIGIYLGSVIELAAHFAVILHAATVKLVAPVDGHEVFAAALAVPDFCVGADEYI